jgi:hypothetical protein
MSSPSPVPRPPTSDSRESLTLQWQAGMERLKHFEVLVSTGLGLYLAALAYAVSQILGEAQNPTEQEYWSVVFVLAVLCLSQLHVVDRVNDAAGGVIELEAASKGSLTYMSNVARRVTWTSSFGFLTTFVMPAVSILGIMFAYRSLSSNRFYPFIGMGLASLVFLMFAFNLLRRFRIVVATVQSLDLEPSPSSANPEA